MKKPDISICEAIEIRTNQLIEEINKKDSITESDQLDSEVRIQDWILNILCSNNM